LSAVLGKAALRLLRFLGENGHCNCFAIRKAKEDHILLETRSGKRLVVDRGIFNALINNALLKSHNARVELTPLGAKRLKRMMTATGNDPDGFAGQHRNTGQREIRIGNDMHAVTINANESPLTRLRKRQDGHGRPWINDAAYEAGERLRRDFTIGGLMQKVTASWDAAIGNAGSKSGAGAKADLTNSAIDARQRLDNALGVVGPDLAGVLTDFCCFLKGLESIERERRWPPRSAKLMLRTGLDLLAGFYGLEARGPARGAVQSWGAEGYPPKIGG